MYLNIMPLSEWKRVQIADADLRAQYNLQPLDIVDLDLDQSGSIKLIGDDQALVLINGTSVQIPLHLLNPVP